MGGRNGDQPLLQIQIQKQGNPLEPVILVPVEANVIDFVDIGELISFADRDHGLIECLLPDHMSNERWETMQVAASVHITLQNTLQTDIFLTAITVVHYYVNIITRVLKNLPFLFQSVGNPAERVCCA